MWPHAVQWQAMMRWRWWKTEMLRGTRTLYDFMSSSSVLALLYRHGQYINTLIKYFSFLSPVCMCLVCVSVGWKVRKWALRVCSNIIRQRHHWQNNTPTRSGTAIFPHSVPRQTGTNMGGEENCINVQIAFIKLCHTASGLVVKDLCLAVQRLFPFLVCKTKFDINLAGFVPSSDAIICFFPSF